MGKQDNEDIHLPAQISLFSASGLEKNLVYQHNDLLMACYDLTVTEKKLLLGCISRINSFEPIDSSTEFSFQLEEAGNLFSMENVTNKRVVEEFHKAARNLKTKVFSIRHPESNHPDSYFESTFAHQSSYNADTKTMKIKFSEGIIPYLSQIHENFTKYRLLHISKMTSKYAMRIYELLVMWIGQDINKLCHKEIEVETLKEILGLKGSYEDNFNAFKKNVLITAKEQINANTDLEVEILYKKTGKKVTRLVFEFQIKEIWQQTENEHRKSKKLTDAQIGKLLGNKDFIEKYWKDSKLSMQAWREKAHKLLQESPTEHFPDYPKYLKEKKVIN